MNPHWYVKVSLLTRGGPGSAPLQALVTMTPGQRRESITMTQLSVADPQGQGQALHAGGLLLRLLQVPTPVVVCVLIIAVNIFLDFKNKGFLLGNPTTAPTPVHIPLTSRQGDRTVPPPLPHCPHPPYI